MGGALRQAMAIGEHRASQILRSALRQSMSMSEAADDTVQAMRQWLHQNGADGVQRDPAWVMELLIGLISMLAPTKPRLGRTRPTRAPQRRR